MLSGRIGKGSRLDTSYWTGLLSGSGRGGSLSDADGLWMTRLQWNITSEVLAFSQSALQRFKAGRGAIAIAAVTGHSRYTSFSSAGGGQLPGFETGESDQYYLRQWLVANWFFNGHRNKLSLDVSRVIRRLAPETETDNRIRLQWDWSF